MRERVKMNFKNRKKKHPEVKMRIGIKENAWWNFMREGVNGDHHWVYHLVNPQGKG